MNKKVVKKSNMKCYTVTHHTLDTHTRIVADKFECTDASTGVFLFYQECNPVAMFGNVLSITTPDAVIVGDKK